MNDLETLISLARLSPQEEALTRLRAEGVETNGALASALGITKGAVAVARCTAGKKLRACQSVFFATVAEQRRAALERADLDTPEEEARFLLDAMRRTRTEPGRALIGVTWREWVDEVQVTFAIIGAAHAGPLVTVDDLTGRSAGPQLTAAENRARLREGGMA